MHRRKVYTRPADAGTETLEIVAYIDEAGGDDEIRVTHTIDGALVEDGIGFAGPDGERWLRDRHASWTGDGFQQTSPGPDYQLSGDFPASARIDRSRT
jgi:hypothetical protein